MVDLLKNATNSILKIEGSRMSYTIWLIVICGVILVATHIIGKYILKIKIKFRWLANITIILLAIVGVIFINNNANSKMEKVQKNYSEDVISVYKKEKIKEVVSDNLFLNIPSIEKVELRSNKLYDGNNYIQKNNITFDKIPYTITKKMDLYKITTFIVADGDAYYNDIVVGIKGTTKNYAYMTFETNEDYSQVYNGVLYLPNTLELGKYTSEIGELKVNDETEDTNK